MEEVNESVSGNEVGTEPGTENGSQPEEPGNETPETETPETETPGATGNEEKQPEKEQPQEEAGEKLDEVLAQLDIMQQEPGTDQMMQEFTTTLSDLVHLLSPNIEESSTPINVYPELPEGYQDYNYPINVQLELLQAGSTYSMTSGLYCSKATDFADGVASYISDIDSGKYELVCVQYVWETGDDGKTDDLVFDYEHIVIPSEETEEPEEPTETALNTVELLEDISKQLEGISANSIAYQEQQLEYYQTLQEIQTVQASGILAVAIGTFTMLGFLTIKELFDKWR